jgi:hypothetical protein
MLSPYDIGYLFGIVVAAAGASIVQGLDPQTNWTGGFGTMMRSLMVGIGVGMLLWLVVYGVIRLLMKI